MITAKIRIHYQGVKTYQLSKVDGELIWDIIYDPTKVDIESDRDYWLSDVDIDTFITNPRASMPEDVIDLIYRKEAVWEILVTRYSASSREEPIDARKLDSMRKSARKKQLLTAMSPEDRALFEED